MTTGLFLPPSWVAPRLPPAYALSTPQGTADVFVDFQRCSKISLDGVDAGAAAILHTRIRIRQPSGVSDAPAVGNYYLYDVATNNSAYAAWLKAHGLSVGVSQIVTTSAPDPDPSWMADYAGKSMNGTEATYQYMGRANKVHRDAQRLIRDFYGPDPGRDHWECDMRYLNAGGGPGTLDAGADAKLLELTQGQRTLPSLLEPQSWTHMTFASPDSK